MIVFAGGILPSNRIRNYYVEFMNINFLESYGALVRDVNDILQKDLTEKEKMEQCFRSCIGHWNQLKEKIAAEGFESDEEEIHFFKHIKPRFTGEIGYYTQRYHAILFLPESDVRAQQEFWRGELARIEKFFAGYDSFFEYYREGKTDQDDRYFLRRNSDGSNIAHADVFDMDQQAASSNDWLLTHMTAYEKYKKHIEAALLAIT
jgi:hypothetical protein